MTRSLLVPICNVYAKGDITADIIVGSQDKPLRLVLDTGSGTLVIDAQSLADDSLQPTQLAQHITYGADSWLGPVVKTKLVLGKEIDAPPSLVVEGIHMALAQNIQEHAFIHADGICAATAFTH